MKCVGVMTNEVCRCDDLCERDFVLNGIFHDIVYHYINITTKSWQYYYVHTCMIHPPMLPLTLIYYT